MSEFQNLAAKTFAAEIKTELIFAQVLIRRGENEFELRHVEDRERASETLRVVSENELRQLSQFAASGAFRPLKSAPNLQTAWRFFARDDAQLDFALNTIYPGAVADWFAAKSSKATPTNYRAFTNRQTGMYRITAMLSDAQAASMIRACCHKKFCLKQRLWTVGDLKTDLRDEKSAILCLEPCAILLEFARKAMRLEQQGDDESPESSECADEIREADFNNPNNPRRVQLKIEKKGGGSSGKS